MAVAVERTETDIFDKQLVFFYELCEAGVVSFDKGNKEHTRLLNKMCSMMWADSSSDDAFSPSGYMRGLTYAAILGKIKESAISGERRICCVEGGVS